MLIRFGYVAMSINLKNASPSKTMTVKQFNKIQDKEAAIRKLERIAQENLANTIRLLKHNRGENIHFYRFSSRLIPLADHELVEGWDYFTPLKEQLKEIGELVNGAKMRVGFHPDHYTLLNSTKREVFDNSVDILERHVKLLKLMDIDPTHRNVLHVGGQTGGKEKALKRFVDRFPEVPKHIAKSLILENDDKTYTAEETLTLCETVNSPMVLDLHHDRCNPSSTNIVELWPRILKTWDDSPLPPKIHISSPKSEKDIRAHADLIELADLVPFLQEIKDTAVHLDIMIEAKDKDNALFDLMKKIVKVDRIEQVDESTIQIL